MKAFKSSLNLKATQDPGSTWTLNHHHLSPTHASLYKFKVANTKPGAETLRWAILQRICYICSSEWTIVWKAEIYKMTMTYISWLHIQSKHFNNKIQICNIPALFGHPEPKQSYSTCFKAWATKAATFMYTLSANEKTSLCKWKNPWLVGSQGKK